MATTIILYYEIDRAYRLTDYLTDSRYIFAISVSTVSAIKRLALTR